MAQDNSAWNKAKQEIGIQLFNVMFNSVLVTDQTGIGGFELDIRKEESIALQNSITDYYAEDNSSLQDNIALRPITFTINGVVGEHVIYGEAITSYTETLFNEVAPFLRLAEPFIGDFGSKFLEFAMIAESVYIEQLQKLAETIVKKMSEYYNVDYDGSDITQQEKAFRFFYTAYKSRELMEVTLPWVVLNNCAITSVEFSQPEETNTLTNVKISFKQMNFASTVSSAGSPSIGRRKEQSEESPTPNLSKVGDSVGGASNVAVGARGIN